MKQRKTMPTKNYIA